MSLAEVRNRIAAACRDAGRGINSVQLLAVTKGRSIEEITTLIKQGQRLFGENRVQEAQEKWPGLRAQYRDIQLHFIGHLQTNKAKEAVSLFDAIETLDRPELALALKKEMEKQKRRVPCFIQVNTGEEAQKGGVAPKDLSELAGLCRETSIDVRGLMCIPPANDVPALHFALLHKFAETTGLKELSMGMSGDFETAIRCGATEIRIGSALFNTMKI